MARRKKSHIHDKRARVVVQVVEVKVDQAVVAGRAAAVVAAGRVVAKAAARATKLQ